VTEIINEEAPDRVIVFGGDCLIGQAPFHYLHELYQEKLGILWIDAHPDVSTPKEHPHGHAMVLSNLLGKGDPSFSKYLTTPLNPKSILHVGLQEPTPAEKRLLQELNITYTVQSDSMIGLNNIKERISQNSFQQIAIHLDLDVLNPQEFRSLLFTQPHGPKIEAMEGKMSLEQLTQLMKEIDHLVEIVGLGIADYLPWDAINLQNLLKDMTIFKE